ncbi:MAG: hypothetical protein ACRENP_10185 [Longimicrobiales bacterium]
MPSAVVPPTIRVNQPFVVTVHTRSKDTCGKQGHTIASVTGLRAIIMPYDTMLRPPRKVSCLDLLLDFEHQVEILFRDLGAAVVEVVGLQEGTSDTLRHSFPVIVTN